MGDKGKKAEWGDWMMKEESGECEEQRGGEGRGGNKREEEIIREGGCFLSSVPEERVVVSFWVENVEAW